MAVAFTKTLEDTLHRALAAASTRRQEYATLEHLLLALIDDEHAKRVMLACDVDIEAMRQAVLHYLDNELQAMTVSGETDPAPTSGFQRVIQRSMLHVQSSGREEVTGANVLVALFSERESYAVYFLQQQDISRLDAVTYISYGVGKGAKGDVDPASNTTLEIKEVKTKSKNETKIGEIRRLHHDILPSSDAVSTSPALSTPIVAEKVVEFLSELLIQEASRNQRASESPLLTVGIYGPWGSGKSTLLGAICRLLTTEGAIVVPINTWRWDGKKDIYAFMNEQLLCGLSSNPSYRWPARALRCLLWTKKNIRKIVITSTLACAFLIAISIVDFRDLAHDPGVAAVKSFWAAIGAGVLAVLAKPLSTIIEKLILRNRGTAEPGETLSTSYKYLLIAKSMGRANNKPVFFSFDDLDRCEPDRVVEFMRSIHRLTASGSISIIGCDDRIVAASIYSEFQKVADVSGEGIKFGERFLEKMVQVHFRMPDVNEADLRSLGLLRASDITSLPTSPAASAMMHAGDSDASAEVYHLTKDIGQEDPVVDTVSLHNICLEVLGAVVELYRIPIRRIKFLANLMKLYCMVFQPESEEAAYRLAAFLGVTHVDPQWLARYYFSNSDEQQGGKGSYHERIMSYLGTDRQAVLALYGLCGLDDSQCRSMLVTVPADSKAKGRRVARTRKRPAASPSREATTTRTKTVARDKDSKPSARSGTTVDDQPSQ